jgi:single-strand DNA-binding protein
MASSMAQVTIFGRVGREPQKRSDRAPVEFSVAVDQGWGDNKTTNWFVVKVWGKAGEIALEHLSKGMIVSASGEFGLRTYTAGDGTQKSSLEVNNAVIAWTGGERKAAAPADDFGDNEQVPF